MAECSAVNCRNSTKDGFQVFKYPSDPVLRKEWLMSSGRNDLADTTYAGLCEVHFMENQFELKRKKWKKLKETAVPTIFGFPEPYPYQFCSRRLINMKEQSKNLPDRSYYSEFLPEVEANTNSNWQFSFPNVQVTAESSFQSSRKKRRRIVVLGSAEPEIEIVPKDDNDRLHEEPMVVFKESNELPHLQDKGSEPECEIIDIYPKSQYWNSSESIVRSVVSSGTSHAIRTEPNYSLFPTYDDFYEQNPYDCDIETNIVIENNTTNGDLEMILQMAEFFRENGKKFKNVHSGLLSYACTHFNLPIPYEFHIYPANHISGNNLIYSCTVKIKDIFISDDVSRCKSDALSRAAQKAFDLILSPSLCIETNENGVFCLRQSPCHPSMPKNSGKKQKKKQSVAKENLNTVSKKQQKKKKKKKDNSKGPKNITKDVKKNIPDTKQAMQAANPEVSLGDRFVCSSENVNAVLQEMQPVSLETNEQISSQNCCYVEVLADGKVVYHSSDTNTQETEPMPLGPVQQTVSLSVDNADLPLGGKIVYFVKKLSLIVPLSLLRKFFIYDNSDITNAYNPSTILFKSGDLSGVAIRCDYGSEMLDNKQVTHCEIYFTGQLACRAIAKSKGDAKKLASVWTLETLKKEFYTIKEKWVQLDDFVITPSKLAGGDGVSDIFALQEDNLGCRMLKMMGWSGGGIGRTGDGIVNPIKVDATYSKGRGLGFSDKKTSSFDFSVKIDSILSDYAASNAKSDILFSSEFTKNELNTIQCKASKYNMLGSLRFNGSERELIISRKCPLRELFDMLIENGGSTDKYELIPPTEST